MPGANSVTSNQETLHKDLEEVVRKYARTTFLRPIADHTREAFAQIKVCKPEKCCKDIVSQPIETWKEELKNDFEHSIFPQYPVIGEIKQKLYGLGAIYAAMSGSGSAVYGIFRERPEHAEHLFEGCYTSVTKAARPEFVIE